MARNPTTRNGLVPLWGRLSLVSWYFDVILNLNEIFWRKFNNSQSSPTEIVPTITPTSSWGRHGRRTTSRSEGKQTKRRHKYHRRWTVGGDVGIHSISGGGGGEFIIKPNHDGDAVEYHQNNTQINLINIQNYDNYLREFQTKRTETHI